MKKTVNENALDGTKRVSGASEEDLMGMGFVKSSAPNLSPSNNKLKNFPVIEITLGENVRKKIDPKGLEELAKSIQENGLLEPIGISKDKDSKGNHKLVFGHRRFKAMTEVLKWENVPVVLVDDKGEEDRELIQFIENSQREDLPDSDTAKFLQKFKEERGLTNQGLASLVNKSESWVKDKIDHASLLEKSSAPNLSTSKVKETVGLEEADRIKLLKEAEEKKLSNKEIREKAKEIKTKSSKTGKSSAPNPPKTPPSKAPKPQDPKERIKELKAEKKTLQDRLKEIDKELTKLGVKL